MRTKAREGPGKGYTEIDQSPYTACCLFELTELQAQPPFEKDNSTDRESRHIADIRNHIAAGLGDLIANAEANSYIRHARTGGDNGL